MAKMCRQGLFIISKTVWGIFDFKNRSFRSNPESIDVEMSVSQRSDVRKTFFLLKPGKERFVGFRLYDESDAKDFFGTNKTGESSSVAVTILRINDK